MDSLPNQDDSPQRPRADMLIAGLCATMAEQRGRIAALEALAASRAHDAATYKLIAVEALHYGHGLWLELGRVNERHLRLVDEYRDFRASVRAQGRAAA